jgi:hypothetical protein
VSKVVLKFGVPIPDEEVEPVGVPRSIIKFRAA